jgi:hypothetical protein
MLAWRSVAAAALALPAVAAWSAEPTSGTDAVRRRLTEAAVATAELRAQAEGQTPGSRAESPAFPRASHVRRYLKARPWARDFELRNAALRLIHFDAPESPTAADASGLREALGAPEPGVRALAAQALARLDEPEDVPRVATLLSDAAAAPPWLTDNWLSRPTMLGLPLEAAKDLDPPDQSLVWRNASVRDYGKVALRHMTGRELDETSFGPWWERNKAARGCLWFWQQRFQHKMDAAMRPHGLDWSKGEAEARRKRALREIACELRELPPEVEAKVRLLAVDERSGGADITEPDAVFFVGAPDLRVTTDRLLGLIDRRNLWADLDWDAAAYNRMVERLALAADTLFKPEHAARLQAAYGRERQNLWWSGRAAMLIGIGRLLPAATVDQLDDARTRDGWLRAAVRDEDDVFVRGYVARELVRVALTANWPFLRNQFFGEKDGSGIPDLRQSVLRALRTPPLTEVKRRALVDLLLDEAFAELWTRPNRRMGGDAHRSEAIASVNDHAGKELITYQEALALTDEKKSAETLVRVLEKVRSLGTAKP